jgi:hypothetical protein
LELEKKFYQLEKIEKLEIENSYKNTKRPKEFRFIKYYGIKDIIVKTDLSLLHKLYFQSI